MKLNAKAKTFRKPTNMFYYDRKKRVAIGFDYWNWILVDSWHRTFYPTLQALLNALTEQQIKLIVGTDKKTFLAALGEVEAMHKNMVGHFKLPEYEGR